MKVQIKKWGNSAALRLPSSVMSAADLKIDQSVDVREENGRVVIEPLRLPIYDLDQLLDRLDLATFPEDLDFGPPVGSEVW